MASPLPQAWRASVIEHLRGGRVIFTLDGEQMWQATFPNAYPFQLWDVLIQALRDDEIEGESVNDMAEGYDTYKFFFHQEGVKLFGKIGLHPAGIHVKIYSAHRPRKGDTL